MALLLRDIRTRFFGHGLGYLVAIAWPLAHIAILIVIYSFLGRTAPFGTSLLVFFATGLVPVMTFLYMARLIMMGPVINKPLLAFPAVKLIDVLFARGLLEVIASCCVSIVVLFTLWIGGDNIWPIDIAQAFAAMGATMLLGVGFGFINGLLAMAQPMWVTGFALSLIIMYITSGVLFVPSVMPEAIRTIVSYNPILHGIEWMRVAYLPGYPSDVLDRQYLIGWGLGTLAISLVLQRYIRLVFPNASS